MASSQARIDASFGAHDPDPTQRTAITLHGAQQTQFGPSNTNRHADDPINVQALCDGCQVVRYVADPINQMQGATAIPEPAWSAVITLAASMTPDDGRMFGHLISKHDPRYDAAVVDARLARDRDKGMGPTTCAKMPEAFDQHYNAGCCDGCPSKGLIKSPAVIAHRLPPAEPIIIEPEDDTQEEAHFVADPPYPYLRTPKGIAYEFLNPKTNAKDQMVICPYDMYPKRECFNDKTRLAEGVTWCIKMPKQGWIEHEIPHVTANQQLLVLNKLGLHIKASELPKVQDFMTAYTRQLQQAVGREPSMARLGFFKPKNNFVLGDRNYMPDGTWLPHTMPQSLVNATDEGIHYAGDYDAWKRAVGTYRRGTAMQPYRVYLYTSFASVLYHMTSFIATAVCAVGVTGRGKSTLLDVCASVWGDPAALCGSGGPKGFTRAGAEAKSHALYHLPMFLDDITEQEAKEVASFIFAYSSGRGKIRSQSSGGVRADTPRWENILLLTGNENEYERMAGTRFDSRQHTMRLIQIEFEEGTLDKAEGDALRADVRANFGWAGHAFIEYVTTHYAEVKRLIQQGIKDTDIRLRAKSEERYWTAWKVCCEVAAEICVRLDILPGYPVSVDVEWMERQIVHMRSAVSDHALTPSEAMATFLDASIPNTLTISTSASNIDNVAREPRGELLVRHEVDTHQTIIARHAFQKYCLEQHINMDAVLVALLQSGALLQRNTKRTLGADTTFSSAQVRCIVVDLDKLESKPQLVVNNPAPAAQPTALSKAAAAWAAAGKP